MSTDNRKSVHYFSRFRLGLRQSRRQRLASALSRLLVGRAVRRRHRTGLTGGVEHLWSFLSILAGHGRTCPALKMPVLCGFWRYCTSYQYLLRSRFAPFRSYRRASGSSGKIFFSVHPHPPLQPPCNFFATFYGQLLTYNIHSKSNDFNKNINLFLIFSLTIKLKWIIVSLGSKIN